MKRQPFINFILVIALFTRCTTSHFYIVITNGTVYDGSGIAPTKADIGITDRHIVKIGNNLKGNTVINARHV